MGFAYRYGGFTTGFGIIVTFFAGLSTISYIFHTINVSAIQKRVDIYGEVATVPVHIQKLRKKIEKDPSAPEYIEALWGTGYRFNT